LPLPRWGVLSGKSRCTSRRWRLYFVQFQPLCAGKKYLTSRNYVRHSTDERDAAGAILGLSFGGKLPSIGDSIRLFFTRSFLRRPAFGFRYKGFYLRTPHQFSACHF
jgi:hypothetical protein